MSENNSYLSEGLASEHFEILKNATSLRFVNGRVEVTSSTAPKIKIRGKTGRGRVSIRGQTVRNLVSAKVTKEGTRTKVVLEFEGGCPSEGIIDNERGIYVPLSDEEAARA